jgi:hypothetical protein
VDFGTAVIADEQPLEVMQPGEGALDDPADAAEPGAVLCLAARDLRRDPAPTQLPPLRLVVVGTVGGEAARSPARSAGATAYRRDPLEERDQLRDVVAVAARERPGERDPARVD